MRKAEKILQLSIKSYNDKKIKKAKFYNMILRTVFGCDILYSSKINETVELVHNGLGCVFHPDVKIEENCKIYQNVTLGGNGKKVGGKTINRGGPILRKNVVVFAGACVLGPITIGENSIIGANAVVTKDVPPNSLAVGVPAVIKTKNSEYNSD
ncbi:serine o-acetyltransferase [Planococcus donghaensis MPA1U2]|uniref:Serine acetyltransferase n=1 Tax=Planococcus donghaensis MPA1U2 TaxID=933115 RepID=E7RDS3_9BACL|nr:serine acetyltransferase [Planococcus donghaensis]EGA90829.1 serine o-acetyltransferase [Planococcus donghaensis MPA1U2]